MQTTIKHFNTTTKQKYTIIPNQHHIVSILIHKKALQKTFTKQFQSNQRYKNHTNIHKQRNDTQIKTKTIKKRFTQRRTIKTTNISQTKTNHSY